MPKSRHSGPSSVVIGSITFVLEGGAFVVENLSDKTSKKDLEAPAELVLKKREPATTGRRCETDRVKSLKPVTFDKAAMLQPLYNNQQVKNMEMIVMDEHNTKMQATVRMDKLK
nr:hypothetical protein [Tanacetum cinerariifolium]